MPINLEKIVSTLQEKLKVNEFLLYTTNNNLIYAKRIKKKVKENLYEIKKTYDYFIGLYKKKVMPFRV